GNLAFLLGSTQVGGVGMLINGGTGTMRPPAQALPYIGTEEGKSNFDDTHVAGVSQEVFADFNNDGQLGFVAKGRGGLDVYLGQSDGTFKHTASLASPFGFGSVSWVKVVDLNNDGIPDIVFGPGYAVEPHSLAVYLGNGAGPFRQSPTFVDQASGYDIFSATFADVNNDGKVDAVATLKLSTSNSWAFGVLFGDGKGNLTFNANTVVPIGRGFFNPYPNATLGDFN